MSRVYKVEVAGVGAAAGQTYLVDADSGAHARNAVAKMTMKIELCSARDVIKHSKAGAQIIEAKEVLAKQGSEEANGSLPV